MSSKRPSESADFDRIFEEYGELLYDLCQLGVPVQQNPGAVFRQIARDLKSGVSGSVYDRYLRAWVLRLAAERIRSAARKDPSKPTAEHELFSSSIGDPERRIQSLARYLLKLPVESRLLLLLKDRYDVPSFEIATILGAPESSLELRYRQTMDTLGDWIWQDAEGSAGSRARLAGLIRDKERSPLPEEVRKAPLSIHLTGPAGSKSESSKQRWQKTPWFIRSGIEAMGLATVILLVIALVPRIRRVYERSLEDQLATFDVSDLQVSAAVEEPAAGSLEAEDDTGPVAEETGGSEDAPADKAAPPPKPEKIEVGNSETWRFNIKASNPRDIRPKVVNALLELGVPSTTAGVQGREAPGGIQFNILVPKEVVLPLKTQIEKLTSSSTDGQNDANITSTFAWYKMKARAKSVPNGLTQVVIWVSALY